MSRKPAKLAGGSDFGEYYAGSCGTFFFVARRAYERAGKHARECSTLTSGDAEPLVAIVFAVMSLESLIVELVLLAKREAPRDKVASCFRDNAGKAPKGRCADYRSVRGMYACLGDASGRPFSSGDPCWDGFCALVDVRNSLVHFTEYSGVSSTTPPAGGGRDHLRVAIPSDIFALLSPRGLFLPGTKQIDDLGGEWFAKLRSPETEEWACKTASQMASGALDRAVFLRPPERKDLRHRFRM